MKYSKRNDRIVYKKGEVILFIKPIFLIENRYVILEIKTIFHSW